MPIYLGAGIIIFEMICYVLAPVLIPIIIGFRSGRSMLRITSRESTFVGIGVAVAMTFFSLVWAKLMISNGLWLIAFGAIPIVLIVAGLAPRLICPRIDQIRGKRHPTDYRRTSDWQTDLAIAGLSSVLLMLMADQFSII